MSLLSTAPWCAIDAAAVRAALRDYREESADALDAARKGRAAAEAREAALRAELEEARALREAAAAEAEAQLAKARREAEEQLHAHDAAARAHLVAALAHEAKLRANMAAACNTAMCSRGLPAMMWWGGAPYTLRAPTC